MGSNSGLSVTTAVHNCMSFLISNTFLIRIWILEKNVHNFYGYKISYSRKSCYGCVRSHRWRSHSASAQAESGHIAHHSSRRAVTLAVTPAVCHSVARIWGSAIDSAISRYRYNKFATLRALRRAVQSIGYGLLPVPPVPSRAWLGCEAHTWRLNDSIPSLDLNWEFISYLCLNSIRTQKVSLISHNPSKC